MVEDTLSQEREHARVPRNHLPQLIHQGTGSVEKELVQHLRSKRLIRRSLHSRADGQSRGQIVDAISARRRDRCGGDPNIHATIRRILVPRDGQG
jgi:hypothetical protein